MPRFCANLSFLFADVAFPERFARAARAGFQGVEYLFPYDYPAREIAGWLKDNQLEQVLFNLHAGDWAAGERGLACLPGREAEFRETVGQARDYALALGCRRVHCLSGLTPAGTDPEEVRQIYLDNLRYCARRMAEVGIEVLIEPINSKVDMPGYWLDTPAQAFALQAELAEPNLRVQLDLYHAQVMAGDLARTLERHLPQIGHIQIADNPGRHEPGSGEIAYPYLFRRLDELGYTGWIGCEYKPRAGTEAGLEWFAEWAGRS